MKCAFALLLPPRLRLIVVAFALRLPLLHSVDRNDRGQGFWASLELPSRLIPLCLVHSGQPRGAEAEAEAAGEAAMAALIGMLEQSGKTDTGGRGAKGRWLLSTLSELYDPDPATSQSSCVPLAPNLLPSRLSKRAGAPLAEVYSPQSIVHAANVDCSPT